MLLSWERKDAIESEIRIRNVLVWCLFIQHQCTFYIAHITQDAEREMHEV